MYGCLSIYGMLVTNIKPNLEVVGTWNKVFYFQACLQRLSRICLEKSHLFEEIALFHLSQDSLPAKWLFIHSLPICLSFLFLSVCLVRFFQPTSRIDDCFDHSLINILISLSSCAYARTDAPGLWNRPIFCAWRKLFYAFTLSLSPSTKISLCCCPCDHVGFDTGTVRGRGNIDVGVGVDNADNDDSDDNESSFFASLPARRQKCVTK